METQVRTPQMIFMQPQRLVVPLFQRPYVWSEERQWDPLWEDVARVAEKSLANPGQKAYPHFLGAVVLQQVSRQTGLMQERIIIDGQQRLTTLQLLLDALRLELLVVEANQPALRIEALVQNAEAFCAKPEDRYKVWPTNRDRPAFNAVLAGQPPPSRSVDGSGRRLVEAHAFFRDEAAKWLNAGGSAELLTRANAVEAAVRDHLQLVVIDLGADENAQEIFETLNARGAQLTAADLIKNFVFQRMVEDKADVERAYSEYWREFETSFWEADVNVGRTLMQRSSLFMNHWLIARTGEEVLGREVFQAFKRFVDDGVDQPMEALLAQIHRSAVVYREFIATSGKLDGELNRLGVFGYRFGVLESEVIKPLVLYLLDPELPPLPSAQLVKALDALESWMVRRMLVRVTSKAYNQVIADIIQHLKSADRSLAGDRTVEYLASQTSERSYWPDDEELERELKTLPIYRRVSRARLRMVLEALEDTMRSIDSDGGLTGERVVRGRYTIEHLMPRKWVPHWPLVLNESEAEREKIIHVLGNLTLVTKKLNSKISNGPWIGEEGKRAELHKHSVCLMNRAVLDSAPLAWTPDHVTTRTDELINRLKKVWPVPVGHKARPSSEKPRKYKKVSLEDLISAGLLHAGTALVPRHKKLGTRVVTVLSDGQVDLDGVALSIKDAAGQLRGRPTNPWWFFMVDPGLRRTLGNVKREYIDSLPDAEDADDDDDEDEDE